MQLSCNRGVLAAVFKALLIAVTFACLLCSPEKLAHAFVFGCTVTSRLAAKRLVPNLVSVQQFENELAATEALTFVCTHSLLPSG